MSDTETNSTLDECTRAILSIDVDWAMRAIPEMSDGTKITHEVALIALHKARYECLNIPAELRHTSGHWLREREYSRCVGPLLPEGELP